MVIDSSVILAIVFDESDGMDYAAVILDNNCVIGALNYLEVWIVADRQRNKDIARKAQMVFENLAIDVIPFTIDHAVLARRAYDTFGKVLHPAKLNMGDCCAYALAQDRGEPLFFKGGDFALTDVRAAHQ